MEEIVVIVCVYLRVEYVPLAVAPRGQQTHEDGELSALAPIALMPCLAIRQHFNHLAYWSWLGESTRKFAVAKASTIYTSLV